MDEFKEYDTIMITVSDGSEKEFAIIEEFEKVSAYFEER